MPRVRVNIRTLNEAEQIDDFEELLDDEQDDREQSATTPDPGLARRLAEKKRWKAINRDMRRHDREKYS